MYILENLRTESKSTMHYKN
nr:unnamed protein product [Callosobruchus chinensis]